MNKLLISVVALFSLGNSSAFAESMPAKALLLDMNQASHQLSYELSYIFIQKNGIEPLLYRYSADEKANLAHLIYLSGPVREVIKRNDEVSYIEPGNEPYTVKSNSMVAPIFPLLNSNVERLSQFYDFVNIGRGREAGAACQVIRVVPKDGLRYSYVLWVSEHNKLPLRADLVDRDGEVLEQFRAISYNVNEQLPQLMSGLNTAELPAVLSLPSNELKDATWSVEWLPNGFVSKELSRYRMAMVEKEVENQLFSDGLFNFSVYVSELDDTSLHDQLIRQGRRTLLSVVKGTSEVSVIGDIPPSTAKRVAESVTFNTP
ncbi:sigma-E factor regulatory protein RseB [Vibrio sp. WJH972]